MQKNVDHLSIETHGDLGIPHFKNPWPWGPWPHGHGATRAPASPWMATMVMMKSTRPANTKKVSKRLATSRKKPEKTLRILLSLLVFLVGNEE